MINRASRIGGNDSFPTGFLVQDSDLQIVYLIELREGAVAKKTQPSSARRSFFSATFVARSGFRYTNTERALSSRNDIEVCQ